MAGLVPEHALAGEALELIHATAAHVRSWGGRRRAAIGVDDLHLLDDESATLVAHLVTDHAAFLIMTVRAGEPVADGLAQLWKQGNAYCIQLPHLPEDIIDRLIDHAGQPDLDSLGRRRLHQTAQGNPLALATTCADALPWGTVEVDIGSCLAHLGSGQPAAAQAIAAAGYRAVLGGGAAMMLSAWALCGGLAALARGQLAEADRLLAEAVAGFEINDTFRLARCCLAARAAVTALRGDPGAPALLARADELAA